MFFIVILCSFKVNCHLKAVGFHNNEKGWGDGGIGGKGVMRPMGPIRLISPIRPYAT